MVQNTIIIVAKHRVWYDSVWSPDSGVVKCVIIISGKLIFEKKIVEKKYFLKNQMHFVQFKNKKKLKKKISKVIYLIKMVFATNFLSI